MDQSVTRRKSVSLIARQRLERWYKERAPLRSRSWQKKPKKKLGRAASAGTCSEYPTICSCAAHWQCYRQDEDHVMGSRDDNPDLGSLTNKSWVTSSEQDHQKKSRDRVM
jgi:hypothetical protein